MSFPRYEKYKDSGVRWLGLVPAHWCLTKTKHVVSFSTGWTPPTGDSASFEGENLWANISDLGPRMIWDTAKRINDSAVSASRIQVSPAGSLLFSFKLSIGQVSFAGVDLYTNEAIATFRPSEVLSLAFAYFSFPLLLVQNAAENIYGAKLLNQELIRSASFALPPFSEQEQIAAFLDHETAKIDALVDEQQSLIELLKEKRQAVISHAVTKGLNPNAQLKHSGLEWLGDIPEHWEVRTVAKSSTKITNGFVGPTRDILVNEGVPYVQATHIKSGRIFFDGAYFVTTEWSNAHKKSVLREGDVLIVQTGAGTGDVGLVAKSEVGYNCHALIIVSPDTEVISGAFLAAVLDSSYGRATLASIETGAMHPHLNCGEVKFVSLPLPPNDEQREIVEHLARARGQFEELIASSTDAIALLQERRTALISSAVTGKIDVRSKVPHTEPAPA